MPPLTFFSAQILSACSRIACVIFRWCASMACVNAGTSTPPDQHHQRDAPVKRRIPEEQELLQRARALSEARLDCLLGPPKGMGAGLSPAAMLGGGWTWSTTSSPSARRRRLSSAHRSAFMLSSLPSTATTTLPRLPVAMEKLPRAFSLLADPNPRRLLARRGVTSTDSTGFGSKLRAAASFRFPADPCLLARWLGLAVDLTGLFC